MQQLSTWLRKEVGFFGGGGGGGSWVYDMQGYGVGMCVWVGG